MGAPEKGKEISLGFSIGDYPQNVPSPGMGQWRLLSSGQGISGLAWHPAAELEIMERPALNHTIICFSFRYCSLISL